MQFIIEATQKKKTHIAIILHSELKAAVAQCRATAVVFLESDKNSNIACLLHVIASMPDFIIDRTVYLSSWNIKEAEDIDTACKSFAAIDLLR